MNNSPPPSCRSPLALQSGVLGNKSQQEHRQPGKSKGPGPRPKAEDVLAKRPIQQHAEVRSPNRTNHKGMLGSSAPLTLGSGLTPPNLRLEDAFRSVSLDKLKSSINHISMDEAMITTRAVESLSARTLYLACLDQAPSPWPPCFLSETSVSHEIVLVPAPGCRLSFSANFELLGLSTS